MLDFTPVREKKVSWPEFTANITPNDLRDLTNEMVDTMLALIQDCEDADVTFVPTDPGAHDAYAEESADVDLAWNLGHVIVHTTASSEESAALATELARGADYRNGRSRSEVPWQTITTIAQCRHRLAESRRMRLASLDMWPDPPHLDNTYEPRPGYGPVNAIVRFLFGLSHDTGHLAQIERIVAEAKAARGR